MRDVIPKILEILQAGTETTVDLFDILSSGSRKKAYRAMLHPETGFRFNTDWADAYRERQRFYSILNKLKNEGLVQKRPGSSRLSQWSLTGKGRARIRHGNQGGLASPSKLRREEGSSLKIISFDIPERRRRERDQLRRSLAALGFTPLHRSVWVGQGTIPEHFLEDLQHVRLLSCIHILEVSKQGTITAD